MNPHAHPPKPPTKSTLFSREQTEETEAKCRKTLGSSPPDMLGNDRRDRGEFGRQSGNFWSLFDFRITRARANITDAGFQTGGRLP